MTLNEFKSISLKMAAEYLIIILQVLKEDKKIEPDVKERLIAAALSLTLYVQDELEHIGSDTSISD